MEKKSRDEILAEMIREKTAAGLSPAQAKECAERQLAHDDALAKASAKTEEAKTTQQETPADPKPEAPKKK